MNHIICAHHRIVNGIFMAVSYHVDLAVYQLLYDEGRSVVLSQQGPFVRSIKEHKLDDAAIVQTYGEDVAEALKQFTASKNKG